MSKLDFYHQYYTQQSGAGLQTYKGLPTLQGHGFGSIFSNIFKFVQPYLLPFLKNAKNEALQSGIRVLTDIAENKPVGESIRNNLKTAGKNLINSSLNMRGRGAAIKRLAPNKKAHSSKKLSCRRDIFSSKK